MDNKGNNLVVYEDGSGYCFAEGLYFSQVETKIPLDKDKKDCYNIYKIPKGDTIGNLHVDHNHYNHNSNTKRNTNSMDDKYNIQSIDLRGISKDTYRFYKDTIFVDNETGEPKKVIYNYGNGSEKIRRLDNKDFYTKGEFSTREYPLYGMQLFPAGGDKAITITEGEDDAKACYEMLGKYPCVSVSSSGSARSDCERAYKYLNSFDKIYLCFDNDNPGQKAAKQVASLFDPNKVYIVSLDKYKDAREYLLNNDSRSFVKTWWAAKRHMPKGIVSSYDQIDALLDEENTNAIAEYPFPTLQDMTYGIRTGETVLFKAKEKIGKTEVFRAIEHHLLKTTDHNVGIIHLEEKEKRTIQGLVNYEIGKPVHLPDSGVSNDEVKKLYRALTVRDDRVYLYQHFGSDDPNTIIDVIRYLVTACHCKFIFLDHITMLVTGFENDDERRKLDYISTRLAMLAVELDFSLFMISHVNDQGETRGSRNIPKVANLIINLERNISAGSVDERNKTFMTVQGNRFASKSGPAGVLWFDPGTFKIKELTEDDLHTGMEVF